MDPKRPAGRRPGDPRALRPGTGFPVEISPAQVAPAERVDRAEDEGSPERGWPLVLIELGRR